MEETEINQLYLDGLRIEIKEVSFILIITYFLHSELFGPKYLTSPKTERKGKHHMSVVNEHLFQNKRVEKWLGDVSKR